MTRDELKARLPNASEAFLRANATDNPPVAARIPAQKPKPRERKTLRGPRETYEGSCRRPTVIITRCSPGHLDRDNLYAAAKKIIDCLHQDGRIPGDTEDHIELFVFQKKVPRELKGTLIEILPIP